VIEADPKQLKELFLLLSNGELSDPDVTPIVDRALLALDDPHAYITDYPDDEWITEGFDLDESQAGSIRLLHWVVFDELQAFLTISDNADELTERVIDRLIQDEVAIEDPPSHLCTLADHLGYLNEQLAAIADTPKALLKFETAFTDEIGLFVVNHDTVDRIVTLARDYDLRLSVT
jgi:hypothetical protein